MFLMLMDHSEGKWSTDTLCIGETSKKYFFVILILIFLCFPMIRKCNMEMVELLPLEKKEDLDLVAQLLKEFQQKTGSKIAHDLLAEWPKPAPQFIKVNELLYNYF